MESNIIKLTISEFSEYTGPRYCNQGDASGEEFYHSNLNESFAEALKQKKSLEINLDGTAGYLSSFLDEAFGNLVYDFTMEIVSSNVIILSKQEPDWVSMIQEEVYIDWEKRRITNIVPKKTINHTEWYRMENNNLVKKVWL